MGKTLWGIDLEESPAGGLIQRLLSEEELEALTDGGRPDDGRDGSGTDDAGEGDADGEDDDAADDADDESGIDVNVEADGEDGFDVDVETDEDVAVDVDIDDEDVEVDIGARGASAVDAGVEAPDPDESASIRDRFPSIGGTGSGDTAGAGSDDAADAEGGEPDSEESGESGGLVARIRPHLLKIAVALVVLGVAALVAWRYLGTVRSIAGDKLGRGDSEDVTEVEVDVDLDEEPPARRRAKAASAAETGPEAELEGDTEQAGESEDEADEEDEGAAVARTGDSDMGALLGLAFLALVAALVRKLTEEREHDPLVDGPE